MANKLEVFAAGSSPQRFDLRSTHRAVGVLHRQDVADEYELLLNHFPDFELAAASREILLDTAALRARCGLRMPDVIQLATGLRFGATAFMTNGAAWKKLSLGKMVILSGQIS